MTSRQNPHARSVLIVLTMLLLGVSRISPAFAQPPNARIGEAVPRDVREIYNKGLQYLVSTQSQSGGWSGGQTGPGVTGLGLMVFLASGEDPNFGKYSGNVKRAIRSLITEQDKNTGILGNSMYHHVFAMLGLAEAYGTVDDRNLWPSGNSAEQLSVGQSLELSVRGAVTSQKSNSMGAWRYSPSGSDADTSVAGAVLMGLLAARNAGIEVPDESLDNALNYFKSHTADGGTVAYSGGVGGGSENMTCIAALVYAVGRKRDWPQFKATVGNLSRNLQGNARSYEFYNRYYKAQALFQGNFQAWARWNQATTRVLKAKQLADGSFDSSHGKAYGTAMSMLALALNYRFLPIYER